MSKNLLPDCGYITDSVPTAVWMATLIKTYINHEIEKNYECWISQNDIRSIARMLCNKNIDIARISQWCNADHSNNTYNYLRASKSLRRLTKVGEFNGKREMPGDLNEDLIIFNELNIKLYHLIEWYRNEYSEFEKNVNAISDTEELKELVTNEPIKNNRDEFSNTDYFNRILKCIDYAWLIFINKVGHGSININKEASMQLHFANIISHLLPMCSYAHNEKAEVELETAINDGYKIREADIVIEAFKDAEHFKVAIELKCYKTLAASGGKRGAHDIFMKDVYFDMELIEKYINNNQVNQGICFVMTDYKSFVNPKLRGGKCWDYDISNGTKIENKALNTPIGGSQVSISLSKKYEFNWDNVGDYYFLKLQGK